MNKLAVKTKPKKKIEVKKEEGYIFKMPEIFSKINFKKVLELFMLFVLFVSLSFNINSYFKLPTTITKEKIISKNVIKYVEKEGGTSTENIITYLNSRIDPSTAETIAKAVDVSSKKYSLPRKLVLSIMDKESFFNPLAKSFKDCVGLMQVNPKAHPEKIKGIPKTHLYHIDINVDIGCKIFKEYFDKSKGNLKETFHSYLGKKANKQEIGKYMNDIIYTFAELEMYEYSNKEKEKKDENDNGKENINGKKSVNNNNNINLNNGVLPESD